MALKVIGTGFGRTSTTSLKGALEQIGYGPCYHMIEVFGKPGHPEGWQAAAADQPEAWRPLLENYQSAVDWPTTYFYPRLIEAYPDAKIIHTERDPAAWYKSFTTTILTTMTTLLPPEAPEPRRMQQLMTRDIIVQRTFGGDLSEANVLRVYNEHNARVKKQYGGRDNFLVYEPGDGWEPLCKFLGVPVPAEPYPKRNTSEEFQARQVAGNLGKYK